MSPEFASRLARITIGMPDDTALTLLTNKEHSEKNDFDKVESRVLHKLLNHLQKGIHGDPVLTLGEIRNATAADLLTLQGITEWSVVFLEYAFPKKEV